MQLPVNEIFQTVQGEATFTGTPSVFVRLQGCDVGCPWCDTKHTWGLNTGDDVPLATVIGKTKDSPQYAAVDVLELLGVISSFQARHVVITGGEPCTYDLGPLTRAVIDTGRSIQIETSGTSGISCDDRAWVTVSPKFGMPGGLAIDWRSMRRSNEVKMPVGKQADVDKVLWLQKIMMDAHHWTPTFPIWLQPLSQSDKATRLCIDAATHHGFRISIQTHKFLGVR